MEIKGGKVFIDNNPPPILDTIASYFLHHFMALLSEGTMPITSVILYVKETGFTNTALMIEVINASYGVYMTELNKYEKTRVTNG